MNPKTKQKRCLDIGPPCPRCHAQRVFCLLDAGHEGDHEQRDRKCGLIRWEQLHAALDEAPS